MDEPTKAPVAPIESIHVAVIGTGTGDGGAPIPDGTILKTPDHQPNIVVQVVTPLAAMAIRFANSYVTTLIGLVTVGLTTDALSAPDFGSLVWKCSGYSLAGPSVALLKDAVTILTNLEKKFPLLTGSV